MMEYLSIMFGMMVNLLLLIGYMNLKKRIEKLEEKD